MDWARMLAYVTGTVDQELLARNEYLAAEIGILKAQLQGDRGSRRAPLLSVVPAQAPLVSLRRPKD